MPATQPQVDLYGKAPPSHVPAELIRWIDIFDGPDCGHDPHAPIRDMLNEPPMIYNLHNPMKGQAWVPTRAEHIREIAANPKLFSSQDQLGFGLLIGEDWRLAPIELDPPDHTKLRKILNPWFSPPAVNRLTDKIRARAIELIDEIAPQNGCEFMSSFAFRYPISIFMEMFGLPEDHTDTFLEWNSLLLHTGDIESKSKGAKAIVDYLREFIEERRIAPRDDIVSWALAARIDEEPISDIDLLGISINLFTGGLDTVASSLGFYFRYLAQHPEVQERIRNHPEEIAKISDEFLRVFTPTQAHRQATEDTEIAGVTVKKGDWINLHFALANYDEREYERPTEIDFDRRNLRQLAFSFGPHFCIGSHLARRELQIAMEEWMRRIPTFRITDGEVPTTHGGLVFGVDRLVLEW